MDESFDFTTPFESLTRVIAQDSSSEFKIIVNYINQLDQLDKIIFQTTINKARIISNNINHLYQIDPTISEYEIKIPPKFESSKKMNDSSILEKMLYLLIKSTKETVQIPKEQCHFFTMLRYLLGEDEEGIFQFKISNEKEAISFLSTGFHSKSIEYLSTNFFDFISNGNFIKIDSEIMKDIIDLYFESVRSQENQNESKEEEEEEEEDRKDDKKRTFLEAAEKIFFKFLNEEEETKVILHFLLHLKSDELSEDMIDYFYDELDDEVIEDELPQIISLLKNHVLDLIESNKYKKANKKNKKKLKNYVDVNFEGNELNGIISYLRRTTNKSIHESGDLKLSGGGTASQSCPLLNITKYDSDHINDYYFNSSSRAPKEEESWIEFDFGDRKINVSSYTIRTNLSNEGFDAHPKAWKIVGSNDRENWFVINHQIENSDLNGRYKQHHFKCKKKSGYYRFIRYIQEDSWFTKIEFKYKIKLTCIEFFGSILNPIIYL